MYGKKLAQSVGCKARQLPSIPRDTLNGAMSYIAPRRVVQAMILAMVGYIPRGD